MLQEMFHTSLTPDVARRSAAISACEKGGHWEEALRLLQVRLHRSFTPNVVSHNFGICVCEKSTHYP